MIITYTERAIILARALKRLSLHFEVRPSFAHCSRLMHKLLRGSAYAVPFDLYNRLVHIAYDNINAHFAVLCKEELKIYIQNRCAALKENPSRPLPLP